ncbi:MAG TPA: PEP-CTERM sorting domain-containing protein [Pyrinomonadaceae bacterium]|nr:PEP-CTERM sorting domain-containing protein [Pyrinomonadaceae bacterium]
MKSKTKLIKLLSIAFALVAVFTFAEGQARADEVTVSGSTSGVISNAPQLHFGNNTFSGTTFQGIGALSGTNSLGTFFLDTSPTGPVNGDFVLNITFTSPTGINGGQGTFFRATILGTVSSTDQGGVFIDFDNTPTTFSFADAVGNSGFFSLQVPDIFVQSGREALLTAGLRGSQTSVPEPVSLVLLGSGLSGIAFKLRKRRKSLRSPGASS